MTTPETLLRKWLETHSRTDFNRELIEETEKWLGDLGRDSSEQRATNPFEQLRAWCNTESRKLPIEEKSHDTQSTRIRELEVQVEEARSLLSHRFTLDVNLEWLQRQEAFLASTTHTDGYFNPTRTTQKG